MGVELRDFGIICMAPLCLLSAVVVVVVVVVRLVQFRAQFRFVSTFVDMIGCCWGRLNTMGDIWGIIYPPSPSLRILYIIFRFP